jgi:hypothetical protein
MHKNIKAKKIEERGQEKILSTERGIVFIF